MNPFILIALGILALPMIGIAQVADASTACPIKEQLDDDVVLTICNHGQGMVPRPQPRLYLRVYADGRGELESNEAPPLGDAYENETLVIKMLHVDADEIAEIRRLGQMPDFQSAKDVYPAYAIGTDSSVQTTVVFIDHRNTKKIVVNNFSYANVFNKKHYGPSFCILMARVAELHDRGLGIIREPPTISFCELMRNRESYIDTVVGINAVLEFNETQQFIYDPECAERSIGPLLFTTEKVGVGFDFKKGKSKELQNQALSVRDKRFGGRARVYIHGILRDNREQTGNPNKFRFDISEFKTIDPIVLSYEGKLEPGWMYVDSFDANNEVEPKLSSRLKMPLHHAARIEWLNAGKFPRLRAAGHTFITFRVVSRDIRKIGVNRWNDIYTCEILDLQ